MSASDLEKIIEQAKAQRPVGQVHIFWDPNTGQSQIQTAGDMSPAEIIFALEVGKELLMRKFVPQSSLVAAIPAIPKVPS